MSGKELKNFNMLDYERSRWTRQADQIARQRSERKRRAALNFHSSESSPETTSSR